MWEVVQGVWAWFLGNGWAVKCGIGCWVFGCGLGEGMQEFGGLKGAGCWEKEGRIFAEEEGGILALSHALSGSLNFEKKGGEGEGEGMVLTGANTRVEV